MRKLADLATRGPAQPGRPAHVAAASGLVQVGERLVVAVDDELALATFALDGSDGQWIPLDGPELPLEHAARKAAKPDVEALALLPDGRVLALGSGATAARERAWTWAPGERARPLDLSDLYVRLRAAIPQLNLEGAAWHRDALWLAQRGNGAAGFNALVRVDLARCTVEDVVPVGLGELDGVALTLSDLDATASGGLGFAAVAEATVNPYDDGPIGGAVLGLVDTLTGAVGDVEELPEALKVEGICGDLLVADADDDAHPAPLLSRA